jgi:hypothetical protein
MFTHGREPSATFRFGCNRPRPGDPVQGIGGVAILCHVFQHHLPMTGPKLLNVH